jgi:PAS domain S-box-containing protein
MFEKMFDSLPYSLTICDTEGIVLYMNDKSVDTFESDGGRELVGKNLLDCHPEPSRSKLRSMLDNKTENIYTIEKKGKKKIIHQSPWYTDGKYMGFVETSMEIPSDMPHFVRE